MNVTTRSRPAPRTRRLLSDLARRRGTLAAVSAALFGIQLDFFALNLALPGISRTFTAGAQAVQWTLSGYMLSLGALFIVGGRLGDILGRRSALLAGCALFTGTVIGAALAPSLAVLVAFRVLQGAGAGLIFPVGIAAVTNAVPGNGRAKALGLTFALANVGTALGPFVGGALAQGLGWRWIFWTLVPVSGSALVLTLRFVPQLLVRRGLMKPLSMAADVPAACMAGPGR